MNSKAIRFASALLLATSIHTASIAFGAQPASPAAQTSTRTGEVEIEGTLTSYQGTTMVVAGLSIDVSRAEIQRGLVVGDWVKVHATRVANGNWVAREVERETLEDDDNAAGHLEMFGTVDALSTTSITVSGMTFLLNNTEFQGAIAVGSSVKVEFNLVNGQAVAREVKLALPGEDDDNSRDDSDSDSPDDSSDDNSGRGSDDSSSDDRGSDSPNDSSDDNSGRGSDDSSSDDHGSDDNSGSGSDDSGSDDHDGDDDHSGSNDDGSDDHGDDD
jgi:hypothetical protein